MYIAIFITIITVLIIEFGLDRYLAILNIRNSSKPLPFVLHGVYDAGKYIRQQEYFRTNARFGAITSTFSFVIVLLMYLLQGFGWVDSFIFQFTDNNILQTLFFFGILMWINNLLFIPFDWYQTFVVEEKFGFNKVTPGIFITDRLKSWLLGALFGGGILTLILLIYNLTPVYFWLLAFSSVTFISLITTMFYSELIVPLFNKQTPLPQGPLRDAIEQFADKVDFKLKNIYIIDGSKRSTKANAYFSGIGPKKRIVLFDTLISQLDTEEIVAVLAHEIGHFKHKHIMKNVLFTLPFNLLLFYLLGLILQSDILAQVMGGKNASFHLNAIAFFTLYTPISTVLDLAGNQLSRKYEFQADAFAAKYGYAEALISGLKKLSSQSLSNLMPHPLYVFFNYSHPTLFQRILRIKSP